MDDDDLLYHYTTVEGLIGMLGNRHVTPTFRLTQVGYTNDEADFWHAQDLASEKILRLHNECPRVLAAMRGLWRVPPGGMLMLAPTNSLRDGPFNWPFVFQFSLTRMPDLLSQWRGYAPDGGYSLGFRYSDLKSLAKSSRLRLDACVYDEQKKGEMIEAVVREAEALVVPPIPDAKPSDNNAERSAIAGHVQKSVTLNWAPFFKHPSFEEEQEWRLVATRQPTGWRARGNMIVPFYEIDISARGKNPVPVREIIIGPGVNFKQAEEAIKSMTDLVRRGALTIRRSKSTLRH
jgi:hypothetical protein